MPWIGVGPAVVEAVSGRGVPAEAWSSSGWDATSSPPAGPGEICLSAPASLPGAACLPAPARLLVTFVLLFRPGGVLAVYDGHPALHCAHGRLGLLCQACLPDPPVTERHAPPHV